MEALKVIKIKANPYLQKGRAGHDSECGFGPGADPLISVNS
jgi:hypothetical protein